MWHNFNSTKLQWLLFKQTKIVNYPMDKNKLFAVTNHHMWPNKQNQLHEDLHTL